MSLTLPSAEVPEAGETLTQAAFSLMLAVQFTFEVKVTKMSSSSVPATGTFTTSVSQIISGTIGSSSLQPTISIAAKETNNANFFIGI